MTVQEIKSKLAKKAVEFSTGGFKPTNADNESCIGRVYLYKQDEEIPCDKDDKLMFPLFQLCITELPFVPKLLSKTKAITVFIAEDFPKDLAENGNNWVLREYTFEDKLIIKHLGNIKSGIKTFPLGHKFMKKITLFGTVVEFQAS